MKTRAKRIAAILMAAVMTAALAVPVFADDGQTENASSTATSEAATKVGDKTGGEVESMAFTKTVDAAAETYQPEETFTFTVTGAGVTSGETYDEHVVYAGNAAGVTGTITAASVKTNKDLKGKQIYNSSLDFSGITFPQPGIYKFTVSETQGSNADMNYDTTRNLYVYVRWTDDTQTATEVYGAAMSKDTSTDKKSANFENEYKKTNKEEEDFKDLTIAKTVTGSLGDTSKYFEFTLTITSGSNRKYYYVSNVADNTEEGKEKLEAGQPYTFKLKHGQSIVIEDLSGNDSYTVTENNYTADGYKTKIGNAETRTQSETMPRSDTTVTFENNKEAVNPTGIIMNYGPYIAMIVAAAVLAFVFLRRKEEI